MALLSISIDLCGSTRAKQAIVEISGRDHALRETLYRRFLKVLYSIERDFYTIVSRDGRLDFGKLYMVKSIGDEFWYLYDVDEGDPTGLNTVALAMFEALLRLFEKDRYLSFHGPEGGGSRRGSRELKVFDHPIKALVDLLLEPFEANRQRYEYLKDIIFPPGERQRRPTYTLDEDIARVCARLNLGGAMESDRSLHVRSDYIGLEVDRFFRLEACCRPLLLAVGETLMTRLDHAVAQVNPDLGHIGVKVLSFGPAWTSPALRKYVIVEPVAAVRMKGVSDDYRLFHIFGENSLGAGIYASPPGIEELMTPTRAFLAEHGFYAIDRNALLP